MTDRIAPNGEYNYRRLILWLSIAAFFVFLLYEIRSILLPFVVGMMTAYFLDPAADRLERMGLKRGTATALLTSAFFLLILLIGALIIPPIVRQCTELLSALPDYLQQMQRYYDSFVSRWLARVRPDQAEALRSAADSVAENAVRLSGETFNVLWQSGKAAINIVSLLLITPLVAFYLLKDWDHMTARIDGMLPRAHAQTIRDQLSAIDATLAGFIRGQMNVCLILAVYYGLLLTLAGLPYGLTIGIVSGLLVILPYVGFMLSFIIALGVAYSDSGFDLLLWLVVAIYALAQVLESYFLTPKLVGGRVGLHPLWIIFGMLAGAALFGFVGVFLSVPVTAVIGVLTRFAAARYLQSSLYRG